MSAMPPGDSRLDHQRVPRALVINEVPDNDQENVSLTGVIAALFGTNPTGEDIKAITKEPDSKMLLARDIKNLLKNQRDPQNMDLENRDLENRDLENRDLENRDLENRDLENRDLKSLYNRVEKDMSRGWTISMDTRPLSTIEIFQSHVEKQDEEYQATICTLSYQAIESALNDLICNREGEKPSPLMQVFNKKELLIVGTVNRKVTTIKHDSTKKETTAIIYMEVRTLPGPPSFSYKSLGIIKVTCAVSWEGANRAVIDIERLSALQNFFIKNFS